jgi:hypothetical protein
MPVNPGGQGGGGQGNGGKLGDHCDQANVKGDGSANKTTGVIGIGDRCPGVSGSSNSGDGVSGTSLSGSGVSGTSQSSSGVDGSSTEGPGVSGSSEKSNGVWGTSKLLAGVLGIAESTGKAGVKGSSSQGSGITPPSACGVWGESHDGCGVFGASDTFDGVHGESQSAQHAGVSGINNSGGPGVWASSSSFDGVSGRSQSTQHAGVAAVNDSGGQTAFGLWARGSPAGHFEGDVEVTGDIRLLNQDCAEDFDVSEHMTLEAGTVVVLADRGSVEQCGRSYDKRVAGVVSGAGAFRPAIVLGRLASTRKRVPIALMGKVYCKVDAKYSAIEVGDLLTTSPTPGHAMKASDPSMAFGTVIGKALRCLSEGCGLIPVLVSLQ